MTVKCFTYTGKVRGQHRPRFTRTGHAYELQADKEYKQSIAAAYIDQCKGYMFADVPLEVAIYVTRALPKSRPKKLQSEPDTYKPDVDNIAKAVLDALNGIAWHDDSQIVSLFIEKNCRLRSRETDTLAVHIEDWG